MFERFTDRARRVVVLAQEEARLLNHNYIGTEHILLGLIHEGEGVAARMDEGQFQRLIDNKDIDELKGVDIQNNGIELSSISRPQDIFQLNEEEIQIDVVDNGIGIPLDQQHRIFERFFRGEDQLVLASAGTGLGLASAPHPTATRASTPG